MKTSIPGCKAYGTHLFGYVVDFSSVTYAKVRAFLKSTQLPKIYAPYALQLAKGVMANNKKGVSNVSYVREVRACGLTTYRHKAQDGIRFIVSK